MVNIDIIMDMLDWNNPPEIQEEGRALAKNIRCINVFLQPGHPGHTKNVWDNCALILSERSDQELGPYLYQLFKWLTDMNWPGADCIYQRLKEYKRDDMFEFVLQECIAEAKALNETTWLFTLNEICVSNPLDDVISSPTYPSKSERFMQYRDKLLKEGFSEAEWYPGNFFRQTTEKVVFVINLSDEEGGISVLYGFASTAFADGVEEWFPRHGSDNETCNVRNILLISDDESEDSAARTISAFYTQYKDYSRDDILALKKERQKAFLSYFARALKPLGFKKKGTRWIKNLHDGTALSFYAQKSAYSDQYYFNVIVHDISDYYTIQSEERVVMYNSEIYNWQLMTEEQIENLIQFALTYYIIPKI